MRNPTALRDIEQRGSLDTSSAIAMGIDGSGMSVVMSMLSNIYSNGNEAVVREYACNARDSHVEAGQTRPIEVTLPSPLDPQFKVQDYGVGLSKEGILRTYAQYGASTKRESNDQIGAFGIGSKSAFTVGNAFTVTGVKDGEKTIAMFSLSDEGTPTVQILFNGVTDEPNGVLVDVGVENVRAVIDAASKLFRCWQPGSILIDGAEPENMWAETEKLGEGVYLDWRDLGNARPNYSGGMYYDSADHFSLIMGGVPYRIPSALWSEVDGATRQFYNSAQQTSVSWILDVPIGSVDITPSREELRLTPHTRRTVTEMIRRATVETARWLSTKIDSCKTIWEASRVYRDLTLRLNYANDPSRTMWKGTSLGSQFVHLDRPIYVVKNTYSSDPSRTYKLVVGERYTASIKEDDFDRVLFVHSVPEKKENIVKVYAKAVLTDKDTNYNKIVSVVDAKFSEHWFSYGTGESPCGVMSFNDYHALGKSIRKKNRISRPRSKTKYDTMIKGETYWVSRDAEEIEDLDLPAYYFRRGTWSLDNIRRDSPNKDLWEKEDIVLICLTGQQKTEVLEKNVDGVKPAKDYFLNDAVSFINNLSVSDMALLKANLKRQATDDSVITFMHQHRKQIINAVAMFEVDTCRKATNFTAADEARLRYLTWAYNQAGIVNPYVEDGEEDFFKSKLPLLWSGIQQSWYLKRALGEEAYVKALIDYVNSIRL